MEGAKQFLDSISRNSKKSAKTYSAGLLQFQKFLNSRKLTLHSCLEAIHRQKLNVYELLNDFVEYLIRQGDKTNTTIKIYIAVMRSYFAYYDIDIIPSKFKRKVKVPKVADEVEEAIDVADIREILLSCNNRTLKPYLLVLASGGMRASEACAIRLMDLDFTTSPTKVHIRKEYSKTRIGRDIYISDEATKFLNEWIDWKYRTKTKNDTDLVFMLTRSDGVNWLYDKLRTEFAKLLEVSGYGRRKEGMLRRKITFHSLRRFVKTVTSNQVSQDYSEWSLGHAKSPYYTIKEPERREIYATKCMKYLTFLDYATLEAKGKSIEVNLQEKDRQIAGLKEKYDTDIALLKEKYDTDIALLNEGMLDMQKLLKNPEKLVEISRAVNAVSRS
ncbi:MAG: tyrosine-type recombinase/integrase [Candidatus Nitrosopolaris sp.]